MDELSGLPLVSRVPLVALGLVVSGDLLLQVTAPKALASGVALLPLSLVLYVLASSRRPRTAWLALAIGLATAAAMALPDFVHIGASVLFSLVLIVAWTIGYAVGMHRRYAAHLLAQERRLAQAELQATHAQATEERLQMARELHDVVAHSLSVVTVQAAYGRLVVDAQPGAAKVALEAIEDAGRSGLTELRRLVRVFRADAGPQPSGEDLAPAPGLADLPDLIERTAATGVRVDFSVTGHAVRLEPSVDLSAYRIVQEALTNVVRHANTEAATAVVTYRPDVLLIEVRNTGSAPLDDAGPSTGNGLAGMRERVRLLGGVLEAGTQPEGGYRVAAQIPLPVAGECLGSAAAAEPVRVG